MAKPEITVYGAYWCPDCRQSKQFLGEHQIPYNWVDIEADKEAEEFITRKNKGKRIIPTIVFGDGSFLVEPSNAELAAKLELKTSASHIHYDLLVLGGGPAGLTAALYAAREYIDTLVIERAAFGGQAAGTEKLDNFPGFPDGVTGIEFSRRLRSQAEKFGVELLHAKDVVEVRRRHNYHRVKTGDGQVYSARALLIATGSRYRRLNVPGENEYLGAGVHFCATCDGPFYVNKRVAVIGGGNSATEESLLLTKFADQVTILVRNSRFKATKIIQESVFKNSKIDIRWNTEVKEFVGQQSKLTGIRMLNNKTGSEETLPVEGVFIFIGLIRIPVSLEEAVLCWINGVLLLPAIICCTGVSGRKIIRKRPYILETSIPGIFAAGDVRDKSTKQVASAAGEGASAALIIREYLKTI